MMRRSLSALATRVGLLVLLAALLPLGLTSRASGQPAPPSGQIPTPCDQPRPKDAVVDIWGAQDTLIGKCLAQIPAPEAGRPNIYAVAVSPHGTQNLFSREARTALQRLSAKYGGTATGGTLLSNAPVDIMQVPNATQQTIAQVLADIGARMAPSPDDVLILYLVSHGRPDAVLQTALPGNVPILAISADSTAAALAQAHIRKRVIIISACFAASWIPALANDDTIVVTAARADRTSFGCAEDRPLTYFGDAFLNGPLAHGASLAESFEGARKTVTQLELSQKLLPSEPQMFVGKNMQAFWQGPAKAPPKKIAAKR